MVEGAHENRAVTMIYVDDVGRSRDFYRDVVGLELAADYGTYAEFTWGNLVLGLRSRDNARRQFADAVAASRTGASHQVTVHVDDVDGFAARLSDGGADVLHPPTDQAWGMRSASFRDPDGHVWEICEPTD